MSASLKSKSAAAPAHVHMAVAAVNGWIVLDETIGTAERCG